MFRELLIHRISKDYGDSLNEVRAWQYKDILHAASFYRAEDEINRRATQ